MSDNRKILEAFAAQFSPPLNVVGTQYIDGNAVTDGWLCATHNAETRMGVSAFVHDGRIFRAYLEVIDRDDGTLAKRAGAVIAKAIR